MTGKGHDFERYAEFESSIASWTLFLSFEADLTSVFDVRAKGQSAEEKGHGSG